MNKLPKLFLKRAFRKKGPPIHLVWFITGRCDLRCSHCFYHKELSFVKDELSLEEINKIIGNLPPLLSINLTGGEPFIRDDLCKIVEALCNRKLSENISLFTNGFNTGKITSTIKKILSICERNRNR